MNLTQENVCYLCKRTEQNRSKSSFQIISVRKSVCPSDFAAGSLTVIFFEVFTLWLDANYFINVHRSVYFIEVSKESGHNLFLF